MNWTACQKPLLFLLLLFIFNVCRADKVSWQEFVQGVRSEALAQGIRPEVFDEAFANISEPQQQILRFEKTQPERRLSFLQYRSTRADAGRINLGKKEFAKHAELLQNIEKDYGVNPCVILALWGLETDYGHYLGNYPVIKSLATLAYSSPRKVLFRKELFLALHMLNDGQVALKDFKGEWAGGSGQAQFMPSSWYRYAVDYDHTGKKDIWNNYGDAFASIANYLVKAGWQQGQPWAVPVALPADFDKHLISMRVTKSVADWKALGVSAIDDSLPADDLAASIVKPDGGPAMMVFNNFSVLMKWNYSTYYVSTVGYLAEQICSR